MRSWRSPARLLALLFVAVGILAPFLANDVPLLARADGEWSFPAVAECFGGSTPGPGDLSWKSWWSRLPPDSEDFAVMPPWPYGPTETDRALYGAGPSLAHPLGNDASGRDLLARLVHGTRNVVFVGGLAVLLAGLVGTVLGAAAGYFRGIVDIVVLRLIEIFVCFPALLFLLLAASLFGDSRIGLILVMASLFWTSFARIVRGEMLSLRERDFVLVARHLGIGELRILWRHLLPQLGSQIGVTAAFGMAAAIVAESTLSFLGVGSSRTSTSWGNLLFHGSEHAHTGGWHQWVFPALTIVTAVMCCHLLADQLRRRQRVAELGA
ncbi:MAG: ABC transporter permease [Planctomycetes bacterium]|nr:ABC transporter permease [Planctomycetota bacterium]